MALPTPRPRQRGLRDHRLHPRQAPRLDGPRDGQRDPRLDGRRDGQRDPRLDHRYAPERRPHAAAPHESPHERAARRRLATEADAEDCAALRERLLRRGFLRPASPESDRQRRHERRQRLRAQLIAGGFLKPGDRYLLMPDGVRLERRLPAVKIEGCDLGSFEGIT